MPTPRMTNQIARQQQNSAGQERSGGGDSPDAWLEGVVAGTFGGINTQYQVYIASTLDYVSATSAIDADLSEGDLVYVTRVGGGATIVGLQ